MGDSFQFALEEHGQLSAAWEDGDRVFRRGWREADNGIRTAILAVSPASEHAAPGCIRRLTHEFELAEELGSGWAVRPLELLREHGRTTLILEGWAVEPLDRLAGAPMELGTFLRLAIAIAAAVGEIHRHGLVHKDVRPANILVNTARGEVRFTGFGIASRLPRERQAPTPPEFIAGTLPYMAPEQTGRMNRSIDSRSDLYSLGITFYQMLTGSLPFTARDPMEWVHCHIARMPVPPHERLGNIPALISQIVMKLVAKTAEERYQTAAGVEHDLRRCLGEWETRGRVDQFPLAEHDLPDRLLIPEKLYGRSRQIGALLESFGHVVATGRPELVLVSGYSGIGKSSVVNELHKVLVPPRGLFASGKFDQYKRDVPYATLAQAFQSLIRQILSKGEAELQSWQDDLREALGLNGLLIVDLIPELELVIGKQPPVADLSPQDARRRFQDVLRRFIGVFARPEHPLALFLDDLQWLDAATLDLLEHLLTQPDIRHLLLIGAYRDNEVDAAHPLMRKLDAIRRAGVPVQDIILAPLSYTDLGQLVADCLHCDPQRARALVQLVQEKTGGNPYFSIQFLNALADEALLIFDYGDARWSWDLDRIHAKRYTDNVVDLMVVKLNRLPAETLAGLCQLACVGASAAFDLLGTVCQTSQEDLHKSLWEAVRSGLLHRSEDSYAFQHDRIQEAAYSLIPVDARAEAHLQIGRLLLAHTPPDKREEAIFEIVNQLNRGAELITSEDERFQLAELNLVAGRRAKASTAYASALKYSIAGTALLTNESWERRHDLAFQLELHGAECEFLTGKLIIAADRSEMLRSRASNTIESAAATCLGIDVYLTLGQVDRAVATGLEYLRRFADDWPLHPTEEQARSVYERIWSQLGDREIEEIIDFPLMSDPASIATLDVLTKVVTPAMFTDRNLYALVICRAASLSIEHGNNDGSCMSYVWFSMIAGFRFGDHQHASRFGRLGYELVEKRGLKRFRAATYIAFATCTMPWMKQLLACCDVTRQASEIADKIGDITWAAYSRIGLITLLIAAGEPLVAVQSEAEHGLNFARAAKFGLVADQFNTELGLIRTLRGLTTTFGSFDDAGFEETQFERHLASRPTMATAECWYWIRKLQARFFAGDFVSAIEASLKARPLLLTTPGFACADYEFYSALARAARCNSATTGQSREDLEALAAHHKQIQIWAEHCLENFENRAALVGAELARLEGRTLEAEGLYEQAIRSARANGFVHNEALAYEVAARFYAARGLEDFAEIYLVKARDGYRRWGADGKVRQLETRYPRLAMAEPRGGTKEATSPDQQLDVAAVVKASQALSSEMLLPRLIERLMTIAVQNAGADRGLLILPAGDQYLILAEARATGDQIEVTTRQEPITRIACPESLVRYVIRTQESVILDDASKPNLFSADDYLRDRQSKSILCLPLIKQRELAGILLLENTLASHAFTPARIAVLELLAAQAAISLENTRLYSDLQEREAKVRRLVDSNIIGICIFDLDRRITEANDAFLDIMGYSRDDVMSGRLDFAGLTPPDWAGTDERLLAELASTGTWKPCEKEFFRKDGSRVPVLIGGATFGELQHQGVGFVIDLTERKQAEAVAREGERRYREVQNELAHANRVAAVGQLSASIAHEVNQPIAATLVNAATARRFLDRSPPDTDRALQAIGRIVSDGNRAAEIVDRIRALVKKDPARKDDVNINEAILDVIALMGVEFSDNGIRSNIQLAEGLPVIRGDRVQIQQVVMNLIVNALQAMGQISRDRRELLVSTQIEADCLLVAVRDSGPGLSEAVLERVFDAFYTTKSTGLGMGLSICRSIIEAHGGRLWVRPNLPNGAAFQFTLPIDFAS